MRILLSIFFINIVMSFVHAKQDNITFTNIESEKILQFEKDLAYFYGAKQPDLISSHYMQAIKESETLGSNTEYSKLKQAMIPYLESAYKEVKEQTNLSFDTNKAAKYELQLIIAQGKQASFEEINNIMVKLYEEVFNSTSPNINKAAMLRTFLYKYKINILKKNQTLSNKDIKLMLSIAKASEEELNNLAK